MKRVRTTTFTVVRLPSQPALDPARNREIRSLAALAKAWPMRRPAGGDCASILAELPDWFGVPASNLAYAEAAERGPSWVVDDLAGNAVGVMVLTDTGFAAVDVHLLAVRPHQHRKGVGKALIDEARTFSRRLGKAFLTVKTQGPSAGYESLWTHARLL